MYMRYVRPLRQDEEASNVQSDTNTCEKVLRKIHTCMLHTSLEKEEKEELQMLQAVA